MHSYLKSIGFSEIEDKKQLDAILNDVIQTYDEKIVVAVSYTHLERRFCWSLVMIMKPLEAFI